MLLEIAAYLDRYDAAVARGNHSNGNGNAKASNAATAEKTGRDSPGFGNHV